MKCWHKANRLLLGYMDNELSNRESDMVREHIARCRYCRKELEDYRKIDAWLISIGGYPSEERYKQIFDDACERVEKKKQQTKKFSFTPCFFRKRPVAVVSIMVIFLIGGFLYFKVAASRQSILSPAKTARGAIEVWNEKDALAFKSESGEELLIDVNENQKVRVKTPHVQVEAGNNSQFYIIPEEEKPTTVGVVYSYDTVSLLTKSRRIDLTSGTTAYVYPDGKVSKPEKIPDAELKKWRDKLAEKRKEKEGES